MFQIKTGSYIGFQHRCFWGNVLLLNDDDAKLALNWHYHRLLPITIQDTTCCYLNHSDVFNDVSFLWKKILKCYPKPTLFYRLTDTRTKENISATQQKLQYDIDAVMQDNAVVELRYRYTVIEFVCSWSTGKKEIIVRFERNLSD